MAHSTANRINYLPFAVPDIGDEEITAVVETLRSGWITTGQKAKTFEQCFQQYVNAPAAVALNSCTGALHVALAALRIGPGDEVITTPMTFCATANVIEHVGATVVMADVSTDTLNIDPSAIAHAITSRTKAILPVHYAGHPADMRPIIELARQYDLKIIEDAAHAMGATYEDQIVGNIGDFTAFSFYATKNLVTAEGGMLTGNEELIDQARLFALHGMNRDAWKRYSASGSWYYEVVEAGFKYNMTDIQAAMGLVQLNRFETMQERREAIVNRYNAAFREVNVLESPSTRDNVRNAWHLYVLRLNLDQLTIDRAQFIDALRTRNIGTSVHFIPVHLHPFYRNKYGWQPTDFPVAYEQYQRMISLPLHSTLSDVDVEDVINAVVDIAKKYRR